MARFPVIESPCPVAGKRAPTGASEHCGTCDRAVYNLNSMNDSERRAFMKGCSGKVCVAYTVRVPLMRRAAFAASLAAAALVAMPAAADEAAGPAQAPPAATVPAQPTPTYNGELQKSDEYGDMELIGGVLDAKNAEWTDEDDAAKDAPPALPVVADDGR